MRNDLCALPWAAGQLHVVENYLEAVGVMAALRAGLAPASVRRPLPATVVKEVIVRSPELQALSEASVR
jgi:hypothetical protein